MKITPKVKVCLEDFDLKHEIDQLTASQQNAGAVVSFTGVCRDEDGLLDALELEHYPGMAEAKISEYAQSAIERFELLGLTAIHRFGKIAVGDNIVLLVAVARNRQAAFDGANYVMDFLKTNAPFWKKEHLKDGSKGKWVDAKDADNSALKKWQS